jgi:peptidoglycan lytic transglycosylase B
MILYPEVVIEMPTVEGGSTGRRTWLQSRRYPARLTTRASARRHGPRGTAAAGVLAALLFASPVATGAQVPGPAPPRESFEVWLDALRKDALGAGIKPGTVERALTTVEYQPTVLERDRGQAEFTLTLAQYLERRLTPAMLRAAEARMREHRRLLARVERAHGVPAGIVLAVWALESNFGRFTGARPTVPVLATLAYDGRRAALFRSELLDALRILDRGDIELERLKGSWAGALGQPQFLPSSYLKYAQDFDGDGRRDIWASLPDVFGSIAFYLKTNGWEPKQAWGRRAQVSDAVRAKLADSAPLRTTGCRAMRSLTAPLPLEQWTGLGVKTTTGEQLPRAALDASLLEADGHAYLLYPNYEALLAYNCAHTYALSVGILGDRLEGRLTSWPAPPKRTKPTTSSRKTRASP